MSKTKSAEELRTFESAYELIKATRLETLDQSIAALKGYIKQDSSILSSSLPDSERTLFHAASGKNIRVLATLLEASLQHHADKKLLSAQDSAGSTPLAEAAAANNYEVVEALLKQGLDVDPKDDDGNTPLHHACRVDALETVKILHSFKADFNLFNVAREMPIHIASGSNSIKVLEYITTQVKGVDVNITMQGIDDQDSDQEDDSEQLTPLCCAAKEGHVGAIRVLLNSKPPANPLAECLATDDFTVTKEPRTALMIAARRNHRNACEELLKMKPKEQLMACDKDRTRPIAYASVSGGYDLVKHIAANSKSFMPEASVVEALRMAALFGNFDAFANLYETFREIAVKEKEQLLRDAVTGGSTDVVTFTLTGLGCDPNQKDSEMWETAVHKAAISGNANLLQLLLKNGGDVKAMNRDKQTPLSCASQLGNFQVVKVLLDHGADPTRKVKLDDAWHSSLEIAIKCGSEDCAMAMITKYKAQVPTSEAGVRSRKPPMWYRMTTRRAFHTAAQSMPKAASAMLDWRIMQYGSMSTPVFTLVLGFELLDDAHIILPKVRMAGKTNEEIYYEQSQETPWEDMPQPETKPGEEEKVVPWMGETLKLRKKAVPFTDDLMKQEELNVLKMMVNNAQEELLSHPVTLAYMTSKWNKFAKYVYYSLFLLYLLFVVALSLFVGFKHPPYGGSAGNGTKAKVETSPVLEDGAGYLRYIVLVIAVVNIVLETIQLVLRKMQYISNVSNGLDWFIYLAGVLFILDLGKSAHEWQWYLGSVVVACAWFRLLMFLQQMPKFGIYVVMFFVVLKSFTMFALVYVLFLFGFAVTFYMLLRDMAIFNSFFKLILKIIVMTIGELDFGSIFGDDGKETLDSRPQWYMYLLLVIYFGFIIVMTVVVMNLLVGIAVQDIREVYNIAQLKKLQMQAELILDSEMMLPAAWRRNFIIRGCPLHVKAKGKPAKVITDGDNPNPLSDDGVLYAFIQNQKNKAGGAHPEEVEEDPLARRRLQTITKAEERVQREKERAQAPPRSSREGSAPRGSDRE